MSKVKTPFEKTAAALKVMGKKIAAKKNELRRELQCVWIANNSGHAVATDKSNIVFLPPMFLTSLISEESVLFQPLGIVLVFCESGWCRFCTS